MKESRIFIAGRHILYDSDGAFEPCWFDAGGRARNAQPGSSPERADGGRQVAEFFRVNDAEYLIKHYGRGGLPARLTVDRYLYTGRNRTRSFCEWRLLAALHCRGLAVPRPVAASVVRRGAFYTADLIVASCRPARPLANRLRAAPLGEHGWRAIGRTIRSLHDEGVWHADLNAHNILLGEDDTDVVLVDFDRSHVRSNARGWKRANVARLQRSLEKLARRRDGLYFSHADFDALRDAYCSG